MASYPSYPQHMSSTRETVDDLVIDRAIDGTGYARVLFSAPVERFNVRHVLRYSEWAAVKTFYTNNKMTPFTFVWQSEGGITYTDRCLFEAVPKASPLGNDLYGVEVRIATR